MRSDEEIKGMMKLFLTAAMTHIVMLAIEFQIPPSTFEKLIKEALKEALESAEYVTGENEKTRKLRDLFKET